MVLSLGWIFLLIKGNKLEDQQQILLKLLRNARLAEHLVDARHSENSQINSSIVVQGSKVEDRGQ